MFRETLSDHYEDRAGGLCFSCDNIPTGSNTSVKIYESKAVRNVGIVGHGHCGKTSLTAALLFTTGGTNRLLRVDEGNTLTDFEEEEVHRKISISSALAAVEWNGMKVNLIDTPGYNIFLNDTRSTMVAADGALVLVDAVAGVEIQTEKVWSFASDLGQPRAILINKLDRERADFGRALKSIQSRFGREAVPIHLPIGAEKSFIGIIDLIRMKAYTYTPDGNGKGKEGEIPDACASEAREAHEALVEFVAEGNDSLMEEFFDTGTLPVEHIVEGLDTAVREGRMYPVMCGSALRNIGSDLLLTFLEEAFPAPDERKTIRGTVDGREMARPISSKEMPATFVFKTMTDPFAGRVSFFKVWSGTVRNEMHLLNARTGADEKLCHIGVPLGKTIVPVNEVHAGDIGCVAKLKETLSGDSLSDKHSLLAFPPITLPEPSIAFAIEAKSRQDEDRIGQAMHRLLEEDLSLRFYRDPQTKDFLIGGTGQQHVEIVASRLKKRFHVDVTLKAPKIPYRETIRGTADVQGRHKKQTGGHGQYGDCWIRMTPLERGARFEFVNATFGGSIPKNYIPAVEKGIVEAAEKGFLAGYPVVDFRVEVYDGSYHDVDSSELAFKLAARKAFRNAMQNARPALLEPVMSVDVHGPVEFAGDLIGDMNSRRGRIAGMDSSGTTQHIRAKVPMAEMLNYQNDLTAMTQGRASFTMEFDHYDFVPGIEAEKVIAASRSMQNIDGEED